MQHIISLTVQYTTRVYGIKIVNSRKLSKCFQNALRMQYFVYIICGAFV